MIVIYEVFTMKMQEAIVLELTIWLYAPRLIKINACFCTETENL